MFSNVKKIQWIDLVTVIQSISINTWNLVLSPAYFCKYNIALRTLRWPPGTRQIAPRISSAATLALTFSDAKLWAIILMQSGWANTCALPCCGGGKILILQMYAYKALYHGTTKLDTSNLKRKNSRNLSKFGWLQRINIMVWKISNQNLSLNCKKVHNLLQPVTVLMQIQEKFMIWNMVENIFFTCTIISMLYINNIYSSSFWKMIVCHFSYLNNT